MKDRSGPGHDFPALENEERFILAPMDMGRRPATGKDSRLAERIRSAGLLAGGKYAIDIADCGEDRAFTRAELNELCWCEHKIIYGAF